jgi:hypothetical protein
VIGVKEINAEFYQGSLTGRDHFGNLSVGRLILKPFFFFFCRSYCSR